MANVVAGITSQVVMPRNQKVMAIGSGAAAPPTSGLLWPRK